MDKLAEVIDLAAYRRAKQGIKVFREIMAAPTVLEKQQTETSIAEFVQATQTSIKLAWETLGYNTGPTPRIIKAPTKDPK